MGMSSIQQSAGFPVSEQGPGGAGKNAGGSVMGISGEMTLTTASFRRVSISLR